MISKASAGYVCNDVTDYLCSDCQFRKGTPEDAHCSYFAPDVKISFSSGSCNRWKTGSPRNVPWLAPYLTPVQLGYLENKNGFGCKRCEELLPKDHACMKVDKNSPGFTPNEISYRGCCDLWQRDPKRGQMTNEQLVVILGVPTKILRGRRP